MKYINEKVIDSLQINWDTIFHRIEAGCESINENDYNQPIKPYLRFGDKKNRIIAMPAYIGGGNATAGIKWIASFPDNIERNIRRAHSTMILNETSTGEPFAILNSPKLSAIRTAGVSGTIIKKYLEKQKEKKSWGMTGFGPIGQTHLEMIAESFIESVDRIYIFDLREIDLSKIPDVIKDKIIICDDWQSAFSEADIFMTCTVSNAPYIDLIPKPNSLHLNVSLRDYKADFCNHVDVMVVDSWEEVCRENTDVEAMSKAHGLLKEDTITMHEFLSSDIDLENKVIMFNPMGMAVFDMVVGKIVYDQSNLLNLGIHLEN